jgi:hypothetical protein
VRTRSNNGNAGLTWQRSSDIDHGWLRCELSQVAGIVDIDTCDGPHVVVIASLQNVGSKILEIYRQAPDLSECIGECRVIVTQTDNRARRKFACTTERNDMVRGEWDLSMSAQRLGT